MTKCQSLLMHNAPTATKDYSIISITVYLMYPQSAPTSCTECPVNCKNEKTEFISAAAMSADETPAQ